MPVWLTTFISAAVSMLKAPLSSLGAYLVGQRQGKVMQERDQLAQDIEMAIRANAARRDAELRRVLGDDPNNRDND